MYFVSGYLEFIIQRCTCPGSRSFSMFFFILLLRELYKRTFLSVCLDFYYMLTSNTSLSPCRLICTPVALALSCWAAVPCGGLGNGCSWIELDRTGGLICAAPPPDAWPGRGGGGGNGRSEGENKPVQTGKNLCRSSAARSQRDRGSHWKLAVADKKANATTWIRFCRSV